MHGVSHGARRTGRMVPAGGTSDARAGLFQSVVVALPVLVKVSRSEPAVLVPTSCI